MLANSLYKYYKEAYHSCGPNNRINPINPYASICLIAVYSYAMLLAVINVVTNETILHSQQTTNRREYPQLLL